MNVTKMANMIRQDMPARNSTYNPLAATMMAVPRSGWRAISVTGSNSSTAAKQ